MKKIVPEGATLIPDHAQRVFQGEIFDVYQWPEQLFDGSEVTFEMLRRPDTVSVIGVVDDEIIVIDDEQPHTGVRRSFPGGRVDRKDGSIEAAAQREMAEEAGYRFSNWRLLKVWQPYRKLEWFVHVLLAWGVSEKAAPNPDAGEKIIVHQLPLYEVKDLVDNKIGFLGESADIFEGIESTNQLLELPEFHGQEVER